MTGLKNLKKTFLLTVFLIILNSCDPGSHIKYTISNKTGKAIKIKYQFPGDSSIVSVKVASDSSHLLWKTIRLGYMDGIDDRTISIYFYTFLIEKEGVISHVNLKDKKYWKLKKDDHLHGNYALTIDNSFFIK